MGAYIAVPRSRTPATHEQRRTIGPAATILLWLLVINLGIAFGAGLYESRVVAPDWANLPPAQWPNTGILFWAYVTTGPLTLLTILNGVAAWRERDPRRRPWLIAVAVLVLERVATFAYFIPTMVALMQQPSTDAAVLATLKQWMLLNHGRHVLTLVAWIFALRALQRT